MPWLVLVQVCQPTHELVSKKVIVGGCYDFKIVTQQRLTNAPITQLTHYLPQM